MLFKIYEPPQVKFCHLTFMEDSISVNLEKYEFQNPKKLKQKHFFGISGPSLYRLSEQHPEVFTGRYFTDKKLSVITFKEESKQGALKKMSIWLSRFVGSVAFLTFSIHQNFEKNSTILRMVLWSSFYWAQFLGHFFAEVFRGHNLQKQIMVIFFTGASSRHHFTEAFLKHQLPGISIALFCAAPLSVWCFKRVCQGAFAEGLFWLPFRRGLLLGLYCRVSSGAILGAFFAGTFTGCLFAGLFLRAIGSGFGPIQSGLRRFYPCFHKQWDCSRQYNTGSSTCS